MIFNFLIFFVKRAGHHFSFLKRAGRHQKGAGHCALQKRPRQNTEFSTVGHLHALNTFPVLYIYICNIVGLHDLCTGHTCNTGMQFIIQAKYTHIESQ